MMVIMVSGCGVQSFRPRVVVDPYDAREITDSDIQKAFKARPQLRLPAVLALYEMGPRDKLLPRHVKKLRGVRTVYEVPALLVEGGRPHAPHRRSMAGDKQVVVSLKKLRLLSARARADVLVLSSTTVQYSARPNWLLAFSPLLITNLVLPVNHVQVTVKREVLLVDVRNGYLYEHFKIKRRAQKRWVLTLGISAAGKRLGDQLRAQVRQQTLKQLRAFLIRPQRRRALTAPGA